MILKQLSIFYGIFLGNSMFVLISNNSMMSLVKKTGHVDFFRPLINPFFILCKYAF